MLYALKDAAVLRSAFSFRVVLLFCCVAAVGMLSTNTRASAQIDEHIQAGEFPRAIELANLLDQQQRDRWLAKIARSQLDAGADSGAYQTASSIDLDYARADALSQMSQQRLGQSEGQRGAGGGITGADFDELIDLIQSTIQPDTWQDTGTGQGTISPFPAGVFVDPSGTLKRIKTQKTKLSKRLREQSARDSGNRQAMLKSKLRKVSLTRLEAAAQLLAAQGQPVDSAMENLAGIYEIKYLMLYPESGDIVIAGPAGPWQFDQDNRAVNIETGKPVLQLDDLVVCLRNAWDHDGKFGCSIDPRKQNLAETQQFLATTKLKGKRWKETLQEKMGQQDITVHGIERQTHTARVIVEADYRMKLLGMGLEPTIAEVPSYLDRIRLNPDGTPPPQDVVRWWFTMNYDDVVADADRTVFSFTGTGVKVLSESEFIDQQGERIHTGKSSGPTKSFAHDFTAHFEKLAAQYPVYGELKNVFDLALVSNLIRQQNLSGQINWNQTFFGSEKSDGSNRLNYQVPKDVVAAQVDSVMNDKIVRMRKQNSTVKHHIVGVSGGVSYDANAVISAKFAPDSSGVLQNAAQDSKPDDNQKFWWWD